MNHKKHSEGAQSVAYLSILAAGFAIFYLLNKYKSETLLTSNFNVYFLFVVVAAVMLLCLMFFISNSKAPKEKYVRKATPKKKRSR